MFILFQCEEFKFFIKQNFLIFFHQNQEVFEDHQKYLPMQFSNQARAPQSNYSKNMEFLFHYPLNQQQLRNIFAFFSAI